jgi:hypothetical protein
MSNRTTADLVSRRSALAGLGAGGLGLAALTVSSPASAQDASADMADHPMVGTWLAGRAPNDIGVAHLSSAGLMYTNTGPTIGVGPDGKIVYSDAPVGSWVPVSERGVHFIFTHRTYDEAGALTGYGSVEGYPEASEDGMTFWDEGTQVTVTLMDPNGTVTQVIGPGLTDAAIGGVRLIPGKSGYAEMLDFLAAHPAATPEAGTPTS